MFLGDHERLQTTINFTGELGSPAMTEQVCNYMIIFKQAQSSFLLVRVIRPLFTYFMVRNIQPTIVYLITKFQQMKFLCHK